MTKRERNTAIITALISAGAIIYAAWLNHNSSIQAKENHHSVSTTDSTKVQQASKDGNNVQIGAIHGNNNTVTGGDYKK